MENDKQIKIELLKIIHDHYKNDFTLYWTRSNFFLLLQVGLLSYFSSNYITEQDGVVFFRILISLVGLFLSIIWFLVLLTSTKWIDTWRNKVVEIDNDINPYKSFSNGENIVQSSKNKLFQTFRPEIISNIMSLLFVCLWGVLIVLLLCK
jgi:hypothetical protein